MSGNAIGTTEAGAKTFGEALAVNTTLTSLDLDKNQFTNDGSDAIFKGLAENTDLGVFNFGYNMLGPEAGIVMGDTLAKNTGLRKLGLNHNGLGNGVKQITKGIINNTQSGLERLFLKDNGVDDEAVPVFCRLLVKNRTLQYLSLGGNVIGKTGGLAIKAVFDKYALSTVVDLDGNKIDRELRFAISKKIIVDSAADGSVAQGEYMLRPEEMPISPQKLSNDAKAKLMTAWSVNHGDEVIGAQLESGTSIESKAQVDGLNTFAQEFAIEFANYLKTTEWNFSNLPLGNDGFARVCQALTPELYAGVRVLNLQGTAMSDKGAEYVGIFLAKNDFITTLCLQENDIGQHGSIAIAAGLKENNTLTDLYLHKNRINDKGCSAIMDALAMNTTLVSLALDGTSHYYFCYLVAISGLQCFNICSP